MRRILSVTAILVVLLVSVSCDDDRDTFQDNLDIVAPTTPTNLVYSSISNAREFSLIQIPPPAVNTDGLIPFFEIVSVTDQSDTVLDESFLSSVTINNPEEITIELEEEDYFRRNGQLVTSITTFDASNAGSITIDDGNNFGVGQYLFDIRVSVSNDEGTESAIFEDALIIGVGPELVGTLLYSPISQNLIVGTGNTTTEPFIISGNTDVTFSLLTDDDKLDINPANGVITLDASYSTIENDTILPTISVTSNISGESTEFQGEGFLFLVASTEPVDLPLRTNFFFYPTLEANNAAFGYSTNVIEPGRVLPERIWEQANPSPLAAMEEGLPEIPGKRRIQTNAVVGGISEPHISDVIINSQDLSGFSVGFDLSFVYYYQNRFVEYLEDGRTPSDLEVFISTDFTGNVEDATWTQVNDQISCQINDLTMTPFIGTPYPGDQTGPDPDNRKNPDQNADGRWVRGELDLNSFSTEQNFTVRFRFNSFFTGQLNNGPDGVGRVGRYLISDVHFRATEQSQ